MKFIYKLNVFKVFPTKKNPYLHHACRLVTMTLLETDRMIRHAVEYTAPILFECEAESINEADARLEAATQIVAQKRPDIGCCVEPS